MIGRQPPARTCDATLFQPCSAKDPAFARTPNRLVRRRRVRHGQAPQSVAVSAISFDAKRSASKTLKPAANSDMVDKLTVRPVTPWHASVLANARSDLNHRSGLPATAELVA